MAIIKSIPSRKIINGLSIDSSEISVVSELEYTTNGESCIIVRGVLESVITLNSITTDHVVIKSMTKVTIKPSTGKIDEEYDEIIADQYACIEFRFVGGNWYILSSDGLSSSSSIIFLISIIYLFLTLLTLMYLSIFFRVLTYTQKKFIRYHNF